MPIQFNEVRKYLLKVSDKKDRIQLTFAYLNSTIETLEKGVKYVHILDIIHTFFSASIVDFEQVNVSCEQDHIQSLCTNACSNSTKKATRTTSVGSAVVPLLLTLNRYFLLLRR